MQIRTFALISALALGLPACTSTFSDVRLTSNDSHVAVDAVNHQEARAIQAAVIAAARDMHPVNGDATFLLLTGSTYGSYEAVGAKLGAGYVLPDQAASDVPFYGVRSLRTQKDQGDVTVVVPNADKFGLVDAHLESKKTADGHNWEVVRLTDRSTELHSLADVVAEENKAMAPAIAPAAVPAVAAPETKEPAAVKAEEMQPEHYNWFERNILGKQTQEQKAAAAAEKEAKAQARAAKEAEEKAAAEEKAKAKAEVAAVEAEAKAAQKAAAEAKPAEEAKQPEHYNWFERNILGKQTQEQKAAAAAEKEAKAQAKAAKEAEEKAAAEAKAAEEAAAAAKAAEEKPAEAKPAATGKKRSTWFESKVLGKDNAPEAEPAK